MNVEDFDGPWGPVLETASAAAGVTPVLGPLESRDDRKGGVMLMLTAGRTASPCMSTVVALTHAHCALLRALVHAQMRARCWSAAQRAFPTAPASSATKPPGTDNVRPIIWFAASAPPAQSPRPNPRQRSAPRFPSSSGPPPSILQLHGRVVPGPDTAVHRQRQLLGLHAVALWPVHRLAPGHLRPRLWPWRGRLAHLSRLRRLLHLQSLHAARPIRCARVTVTYLTKHIFFLYR